MMSPTPTFRSSGGLAPLEPEVRQKLEQRAFRVRQHIIGMATDGGCFIGASLSCADLLVYLYSQVLNITPETLADPHRDVLLLSKGHDVPALYGTFAELGFMEPERLKNHLKTNDHLYWHPNTRVPGIEFHSGSLGHLLSVGIGIALDLKMRAADGDEKSDESRVFVVLGDGELDEGSIWEGLLVANAHQLNNLVLVVDRNAFQANMQTEALIPLEPLSDKFEAFGATVSRFDGHDFDAMHQAFSTVGGPQQQATQEFAGVRVFIADTVRGKGLPSIEAQWNRWFVDFTTTEVEALLEELAGNAPATLTSEPLVVR